MDNPSLIEEAARAVRARLGHDAPEIDKLVAEEVAKLGHTQPSSPVGAEMPNPKDLSQRLVISANGRNRTGVVAGLTAVVAEFNGDIRDISQTIVGDYFTMVLVVDCTGATQQGLRFAELKARLVDAGLRLGTHVVALHHDLLAAMHRV